MCSQKKRKRLLQTIDRAKQQVVERRVRNDEAARAFGPFLETIAVPLMRQVAQVLRAESRLFNVTATGRGQDFLRTPSQILEKLLHLADVVSYADFAPTASQVEVAAKLRQDIAHDRERVDGVLSRTLASFNALLRERSLGAIVAPKE